VNSRFKRIDGVYGKEIGTVFKDFMLGFNVIDFSLDRDGDANGIRHIVFLQIGDHCHISRILKVTWLVKPIGKGIHQLVKIVIPSGREPKYATTTDPEKEHDPIN